MKFRLHAIGLFIASGVVCLASVMLLLNIAIRLLSAQLDAVLFLATISVFYLSFLGTERLYAKHYRLGCPDCGKKLTMNYQPGIAVSYTCRHCSFSYYTRMTIGGAGHWPK